MPKYVKNSNYTFKPLNFNNYNGCDHHSDGFNCKRPCDFPPMPLPPDHCPPRPEFPCMPNFKDCNKENFRYFLIGYLFGSWE